MNIYNDAFIFGGKMKGNVVIAMFLFLSLSTAAFSNAAVELSTSIDDGNGGGSQTNTGSTTNSSMSQNETVYIIPVAIYNVSQLENKSGLKGAKVDKQGSENWTHTGTYGMEEAVKRMGIWEYNGKKYEFEPHILSYSDIAKGKLEEGNYKILLAPGDDDYFQDQLKPDGAGLKDAIIDFVKKGGGYIGTCGGADFACQGIKHVKDDGTVVEDTSINTLGIVDAYAYTAYPYTANTLYFYRNIMYDKGTPEEGNGSGVSDWGGIPMKNVIENPVGPFQNYQNFSTYNPSDNTLTLRYWGGPCFEPYGHAVGIAKYDNKSCNDKSILLNYTKNSIVNLSRYIGGKWSIIEQDNVDGKGRIVLFGCHPEDRTWEWGSGRVIQNLSKIGNYSYIYFYNKSGLPKDWKEKLPELWKYIQQPPKETYDIIQQALKWIAEPMLNNLTDTIYKNNDTNTQPNPTPTEDTQTYEMQTTSYQTSDTSKSLELQAVDSDVTVESQETTTQAQTESM